MKCPECGKVCNHCTPETSTHGTDSFETCEECTPAPDLAQYYADYQQHLDEMRED